MGSFASASSPIPIRVVRLPVYETCPNQTAAPPGRRPSPSHNGLKPLGQRNYLWRKHPGFVGVCAYEVDLPGVVERDN